MEQGKLNGTSIVPATGVDDIVYIFARAGEERLNDCEMKGTKPDENVEDHNENAECATKDVSQAEDDQGEEGQDSGCSSDPESCSTDNSDEAYKEEVG